MADWYERYGLVSVAENQQGTSRVHAIQAELQGIGNRNSFQPLLGHVLYVGGIFRSSHTQKQTISSCESTLIENLQ